jgi:hypothetical protein
VHSGVGNVVLGDNLMLLIVQNKLRSQLAESSCPPSLGIVAQHLRQRHVKIRIDNLFVFRAFVSWIMRTLRTP